VSTVTSSPPEPTASRPRVALVALFITVGSFLLANLLGAIPVVIALVGGAVTLSVAVLVASVVVTELGYVAIALAALRRWKERIVFTVPTRRGWGYVVAGTLAALVANVLMGLVLSQFVADPPTSGIADIGAEQPLFFAALVVVAIFVIGPAEELLFRGVVQNYLKRAFSPWGAILLASVFFASIHAAALSGTVVGIVGVVAGLTLVSIVLGYVYEATDNLAVPALVHGIYDAILLGLSYLLVV
jgi:membrane protease YdiL (CAAX protease family)